MKISENAQERLEQLWIIYEENSPVESKNTSGVDEELSLMGLVQLSGQDIQLTETGRKEAAAAIRRHRLAERLLADVLVTEESILDDRACGLEHALFDGVDESICTLLGHPQF